MARPTGIGRGSGRNLQCADKGSRVGCGNNMGRGECLSSDVGIYLQVKWLGISVDGCGSPTTEQPRPVPRTLFCWGVPRLDLAGGERQEADCTEHENTPGNVKHNPAVAIRTNNDVSIKCVVSCGTECVHAFRGSVAARTPDKLLAVDPEGGRVSNKTHRH